MSIKKRVTIGMIMTLCLFIFTFAIVMNAFAGGTSEKKEGKRDISDMRIALCNNYAQNSWRQTMIKAFKDAGQDAVNRGIVREVNLFTTSENSATEEAALLQNLVLKGYDAIVLNSASPSALNGACKAAADAGVIVVSFDGIVTEPSAWRLRFNYSYASYVQMKYFNERLNGKGNVLEIRGLAGTSIDPDFHEGVIRGERDFPGLKVVGSVYGEWCQSTTQKAVAQVLPALPKIDAVVDQGGDGYGCAQAFKAAGRPYPIIAMGNRYVELAWWKEQYEKNGYMTVSYCSPPAVSQIAFWTAVEILSGEDVPHGLVPPLLDVTIDSLDYWVEHTPKGGVAQGYFPQEWVKKFIAAQKSGKPDPEMLLPE